MEHQTEKNVEDLLETGVMYSPDRPQNDIANHFLGA